MPSFIDHSTGRIVTVPGTPKPTDPKVYDDRIAVVWALEGHAITLEHALSWTRFLALERDALLTGEAHASQ